jgi:hypothetical protein
MIVGFLPGIIHHVQHMTNIWHPVGSQMLATAPDIPSDKPPKPRGKLRFMTLTQIDGRTRSMMRVRTIMRALEVDLGGSDHLTLGQCQLCQRAAVLGAYIEDIEARWAAGETIEVSDYLAAINSQRRVLATIGLERRSRDVTPPSIEEYAKHVLDNGASP